MSLHVSKRWDIFCTVVDNFGDIGTCWRLARQLADEHGAIVRLWVDRLDSFARLCPSISTDADVQWVGRKGDRSVINRGDHHPRSVSTVNNGPVPFYPVEVRRWPADFPSDFPVDDVADVVIEAFACELPAGYVAAMSRRAEQRLAEQGGAPVWINLEYLSAEAWVEGCHRLPSPQPTSGLTKHFFFPGFTSNTGGLLRERELLAQRAAFDGAAIAEFWRTLGVPPGIENELQVSLFCYDNPALTELLQCWAAGPTAVRVLAAPGAATEQIAGWLGQPLSPGTPAVREGSLSVHALPFLSQADYDRLLWACDVNFVRGEDSFVRAQWAQKPFVWQIYPQAEQVHLIKLDAFLDRYLSEFPHAESVRRFWHAWNGALGQAAADAAAGTAKGDEIGSAWGDFFANRQTIAEHGKIWVSQLDRTGDLANNLATFVCGK